MSRYPVSEGLVIPPYELGYTVPTELDMERRKVVTIHHAYWARHDYDERYEGVFRNLVTNTYPLIQVEHIELHEDYDPPRKPKRVQMIDVVEEYLAEHGVIHCIKEKHTRQIYEIQPEDWERIRDL